MSAAELRAATSLAGVFGLRMLGLFLILPVFAVHAPRLSGGDNLALVGIALGAYGLAQGCLQIPFGMASDRWGRKPVLYAGLAIFAAGSFLGVVAHDIGMVIAARALQGAGAISSVAMALAADLTREQHRTKVMAIIGSTIGLMFALSLVGAPLLYRWIGLEGLFALTGVLCFISMWVVRALVPDPPRAPERRRGGVTRESLFDPELVRLNLGIFVLHIVLYAMFVVVPPLLVGAGLELAEHWRLYLPVVLGSFVLMVPAVLYADRGNQPKAVLLGAVALLCAVEALLSGLRPGLWALAALMLAFFMAFNVLEALLPSLVSRLAPAQGRGVAIAVYNTTQTLGVFFGGLVGGWVASRYGPAAVFGVCAVLSALWLAVAARMRPPVARPVNELWSLTFSIASGVNLEGLSEALAAVRGVREAEVLARERIARLKVVPEQWDEGSVRKLLTGEG
ncbi:MAG TPA: MFS transporter [Burkholderiales bacterium]|nr:MFS transporter [Burkholderiales bacterium]